MARIASPPDPGLLSLNTATVREKWNLRQMIEGCARHAIAGISPWRDKLAELGAKEAARLIRDHGLTVTGLCRGGMFPAAERQARRAAVDDNLRAIDDAAMLQAKCLVLVVGGLPPGSRDLAGARQMVRDGIGEILDHARNAGVPLAVEPLHPMYCADRACVNTLSQALDLCEELGGKESGGLGVAVDAYHVWWDAELERQIARTRSRLSSLLERAGELELASRECMEELRARLSQQLHDTTDAIGRASRRRLAAAREVLDHLVAYHALLDQLLGYEAELSAGAMA